MDQSMTPEDLHRLGQNIVCKYYKHRTWLPTKANNPSKLELHYWDGEQWHPTHVVRYVPWKAFAATDDELKL
jgi:hypothetical protein